MSKKITPKGAAPADPERRDVITTATTTFGVAGAACAAYPFIKSMTPAANVKAQATLDVDLTEIEEGDVKTVLWRGKPVFVWHRNAAQIEEAKQADGTGALLDPQNDADRVQKPEWLVVMAICTHLGCVPMRNSGGDEGWRCPCHGSQFDVSGRLRRGPAESNLEIPPYKFLDDNTIRIG